MAFTNTAPADGLDAAGVDDAIRANFVAIQKGEHHTSATEPAYKQEGTLWYDSTNNLLKAYDGANWQYMAKGTSTGTVLGAWVSKSANTAYEATTDGFVTAYTDKKYSVVNDLYGLTDASNPPTTVRMYGYYDGATSNRQTISFPVKKGDYWKVTATQTTTVFWIPLGG